VGSFELASKSLELTYKISTKVRVFKSSVESRAMTKATVKKIDGTYTRILR